MDCIAGMKDFPDQYFDLAIVDPPYGDAGAGGGYCRFTPGGWFSRYKDVGSVRREIPQVRQGGSGGGMTKNPYPEQEEPGQRNTAKKSPRGTWPLEKNTSKSFSASHAIRLSGAETILNCRRHGVSWYGGS